MFNGASSMKSQEEESAANKRKRSSFDSDSDDDSSSESGEEETFNSATTTFMDEQEEKPSSVVASSSSSSSVINQNNNTNTIDHDHDGNDEETISEFKKALLLKLSKYSKMITQNELDILEQQLLSNPFSFASEWDELIGQYQYRSYIGQFNLHQVDKRNTDLPTQYSVLLNNQYINVSAREKTRHLRWKRSEFLKLGEESWLNWIREEELHYMEGNFSDNIQRDVIKCIYERALLWENYSYKELRIKYCKFMLKYYKNDENSIDDSFNLLFNLVGYDEDICNLYLKYLKQHSKDSKTRNVYSNLLKHPNQSVFTIWKEYGQWEKEPSDEMKARYIHALKQVEERISFQKPKQDESSYLDMINFELQKYNDCKGLRSTKNFAEMSEEDLNEIGSILKERIVLLLRRVACEINTEKLWNMLFNFLISEKDEFISNDGASSSGTIFKTLKNLHETINRNFKYLDNGFLSVYLQNIEYADSSLASALYLHVTCWVAFKNLSWNSEMHKHLIQSLELLHESNNQHLESSSIYLKLLNDTMFNKCMHALNSFANDLSFNDYYQVFSTVCSSLTRLNRKLYFAVSSRSEPNESLNTSLIEVAQATDQSFQTFSDYLDQYFKTDTYRMHHLELQYAEFILENGQSQRSLDFLENVIVNNETFKKELRAWQDFIQFLEKINWYEINNETPLETKHDKISATYDLGIRSMENPSTKQILARLWLHYEKVNSNSLSNIIKVETLLKQFKDSQKKKKEKSTTGKEKSNNKEKSEKKPKDEKTEKKKKEKEDRPKKKVKFSEEVEVQQVPSSTNMDTTETETVTTTSTVVEQDVVMKESENIKPKEEPIQESSTSTEVKPQKEPKKKESSEKCMNVLVWNLPFSMKEQDIRDLFQQHSFQPKRITLITHDNGSSKGMAFVELDSLETIQLAIEKLHNYGIDNEGNLLKVAHADPFKMKKLLKRQKEIANKPKSAPKFVKESDTRQKKPSMFKPRSVPKKSETINSSASASNETTHPSSNVTVSSTNGNQQQQPSGGLSNDDFKKFLR